MKKTLQKLLAVLLTSMMLFGMVQVPAQASEGAGDTMTMDEPEPGETPPPSGGSLLSNPVEIPVLDGTIVFTDAEFRAAIVDPAVTTIYLGHHTSTDPVRPGATVNNGYIRLTAGCVVGGPTKTIIGTDPQNERRVKLEDLNSSSAGNTINARSNNTLTMKNVDYVGNNYYGIFASQG